MRYSDCCFQWQKILSRADLFRSPWKWNCSLHTVFIIEFMCWSFEKLVELVCREVGSADVLGSGCTIYDGMTNKEDEFLDA